MSNEKIKDHYSEETRLALLEQCIVNINDTLVRFEKRFDQQDTKFDQINSNIREMRSHFDRLISGIYLLFGSSVVALLFKFIHLPSGA